VTEAQPVWPAAPSVVPTFGVEEEFFLLHPDGTAADVAPRLLETLAGDPHVQAEWMRYQVESASAVCVGLPDLAAGLEGERSALAAAARLHGAHLVAAGSPPLPVPGAAAVSDGVRYGRLLSEFPGISGEEVTCACQVHVGVPNRDLGVAVLNRIRGWLPVLLALNGNSPFWAGRDTGWHSYRYVVATSWPTAIVPPVCRDADAYDDRMARHLADGEALDVAGVYWFARLSARYPTVEIRVADTCLAVDDAVLHAGLCRALVATALADEAAGRPYLPLADELLSASLADAARSGLDASVVDPGTGRPASPVTLVARLVADVGPALEAAGDGPSVRALLDRRLRRGSGAAAQRELCRSRGIEAFVAAIETATVAPSSVPRATGP
jgi:carboxylate-amine ligase